MSTPESSAASSPKGAGAMEPAAPPKAERRDRTVGWHSKDVARAVALAMGIYLAMQLLWFAKELVIVAFLGVLFGLAVEAAVDRLERFRIPRGIGAALVVITFFALLFGVGAWITPTIREQSVVLKTKIPEAVDRVEEWLKKRQSGMFGVVFGRGAGADTAAGRAAGATTAAGTTTGAGATTQATTPASGSTRTGTPAAGQPAPVVVVLDTVGTGTDTTRGRGSATSAVETLRGSLGRQLGRVTQYVFPFLSQTVAVFAGLMLIIFMAIYIASDPNTYHRGLMHLFPHRTRERAGEVLSAMAIVLRRWLVTQMIAMAVIGSVTTIGLLVLKVKAAFALGLIAGLLEFIPTVGPILSAVPAIAMAFLDSPEKALMVVALYVGIQFLENHLLIPMLMKGGVNVPPVLTILAQALFTLLFGFLGLMVAVPAVAAVMVVVKMLYVERVIGDDIAVVTKEASA
jgi:predicted PurR-regulated permease PerM